MVGGSRRLNGVLKGGPQKWSKVLKEMRSFPIETGMSIPGGRSPLPLSLLYVLPSVLMIYLLPK